MNMLQRPPNRANMRPLVLTSKRAQTCTRTALGRACQKVSLALLVLASGCGADESSGDLSTINGALWTAFSASVIESYTLPALNPGDDGGFVDRPVIDLWTIDDNGLAQYVSSQQTDATAADDGTPKTLVVRQLGPQEFIDLKNDLARYRVSSWASTLTCDNVQCGEDRGTATLQVNLNAQEKTVSWPLYASGLPEGLERMAQQIKDAV